MNRTLLNPPRFLTLLALLLIAAGALLIHPATVRAHAVLVRSIPAEGATVPGPNVHFELQFNSRVDPQRCGLSISHGPGESVVLHISAGAKPSEIVADARDLLPGDYTAHWQALATDGHITRGTISFRVK